MANGDWHEVFHAVVENIIRHFEDAVERAVDSLQRFANNVGRFARTVLFFITRGGWQACRVAAVGIFLIFILSLGIEIVLGSLLVSAPFVRWVLFGVGAVIALVVVAALLYVLFDFLLRQTAAATPHAQDNRRKVVFRSSVPGFLLVLDVVICFVLPIVPYEFRFTPLASTQQLVRPFWEILRGQTTTGVSTTSRKATIAHEKNKNEMYDAWRPTQSTHAHARDEDVHLVLWVENVHLTPYETILEMACKTWYDNESAELKGASGAYIVDQHGHKYELLKDGGSYGFSFFSRSRTIVGSEIYRWSLVFRRIDNDVAALKLKHPQFEDADVNLSGSPDSTK